MDCGGNARRWILVTREKGIAPVRGEAARWSVDHLLIDQDGVPTLAEVKRGSNPEIRRAIVGQLLEYAAHAAETWTPAERLLDVAEQSGGKFNYGDSFALRIDVRCPVWSKPVRVAWLHSHAVRPGWRRIRDFSFGAVALDSDLPEDLQSVFRSWVEQFSADDFATDVSSKDVVQAWAVSHEEAVRHQDLLVERLGQVVSRLTSL